jgi:hypothetical protein
MQPNSETALPRPQSEPRDTAPQLAAGPRQERRVDGKLWLVREGNEVAVDLVRCFPWTEPRRYLSLRNADGEEQAFVANPAELDSASRDALQATLTRSSFVLEIVEIQGIDEDFELRTWRVATVHGPRSFQTPLDGWPLQLDAGGLVIQDVHGDLYRIPDPDRLNTKSKKLLWAFVD